MTHSAEATRKCAFTLALGRDIYFQMAYALARSILRNGGRGNIEFAIVADRPVSARPRDLAEVRWIEIEAGKYGRGFSPKLHLDKLAPAKKSLFIDADCLCVAPLAPVFEAFEGRAVSVVGSRITSGEWFGDVSAICHRFGLSGYPKFNGGVYYVEPGATARSVYETARQIEAKYDESGFVRLRGSPNDEVCMAVAMELHSQAEIQDDGSIMNTLVEAKRGIRIDTLKGMAVLFNAIDPLDRDPFYPLEEMRPALVHFLGGSPADHPYRAEIQVLELTHAYNWPRWTARAWVTASSAIPSIFIKYLKQSLRPVYRRYFGTRAIRASDRT